jgi:2,4-dienoyl-CoA reductase-like NADH-dependent reductase (Old Yellow Enzyme family)/thioredoxin reductase
MKKMLLEPFAIGGMALKNRIVQSPMELDFGSNEGFVTDRGVDYFEVRARGGTGLIIVGITYVRRDGKSMNNQHGISDDRYIAEMQVLCKTVHKYGAKIALQLHHGGRLAKYREANTPAVAPSPIVFGSSTGADSNRSSYSNEAPKELSLKEIEELITCYAQAAKRAKLAGFDGVELHAAHGYLIDQFLSPASNIRKDQFGGSIENRARFLVEIIKASKTAVGKEFPVWCRLNGQEFGINGGITRLDAQTTSRLAEAAGADAIHVTCAGPSNPINLTTPIFTSAVIADLASGIKQVVNVPVIAVGKMTPEAAENILREGKADLISFGRPHITDPDLAGKIARNELEDIRPCIYCMRCRDDAFASVGGVRCSVNAALGREAEYRITSTPNPRRILIIGGGPAGMEAARVAALRGHSVTLWEKESKLGGQLIFGCIPPHKDRIEVLRSYLARQVRKTGVKVETGFEGTADKIIAFKPDIVVFATGGLPFSPPIPNQGDIPVLQALDVLGGKKKVGERVVIIGGGLVGCELAEYLTENGKKVTVTNILNEMGQGMGPGLRGPLLERLVKMGVELLVSVTYDHFGRDGVVLVTKEGIRRTITADTIVLSAGLKPCQQVYEEIKGKVPDIKLIGDCMEARSIRDAIADGYRVALTL